jgi:hypothetical protein
MRKVLGSAVAALAIAGFTAAPAFATSYSTAFSAPVTATVPVNCAVTMPSISIGSVTFGTNPSSSFDVPTNAGNFGQCNVNFIAKWSNLNNNFIPVGGSYAGNMTGKDNTGTQHKLQYTFTPPFADGVANQPFGGTFDITIPSSQSDAYGGVTYNDAIILSIVY